MGRTLDSVMVRIAVAVALVLALPLQVDAGPHRKPAPALDVSGVYSSTYEEVRLRQHGSLIDGDYACCGGGTIEGRITGRVIKYHWQGADGTEGNGVWKVTGRGTIRGTWGSGDSEDDGGDWDLDKVADLEDSAAIAN